MIGIFADAACGDFTSTLLLQPKKATENDLRREFEMFGPVARINIVKNKNGNSRGYAFIVYERERDMKGNVLYHMLMRD